MDQQTSAEIPPNGSDSEDSVRSLGGFSRYFGVLFRPLDRRWTVILILCVAGGSVLGWRYRLAQIEAYNEREDLRRAGLTEPPDGTSAPNFDLTVTTISADEIYYGGVQKDGIPSLNSPEFVTPQDATHLVPADRVIGVAVGSEYRAYPIRILNFHEIVNDRFGELPLAVTWCPLCDSAAVFDRRTPLGEREFGVSGRLYNSNVLMFDRGGDPESLWSQIQAQGVTGPAAGRPLRAIPLELTTWKDWLQKHPQTTVLSLNTGHTRNYRESPYADYLADSRSLMFPVNRRDERLPPKTPVLGILAGKSSMAISIAAFRGQAEVLHEKIDGLSFAVAFHPESNTLRVTNAADGIQWMYSFWFAWSAMHPETSLIPPLPGQ